MKKIFKKIYSIFPFKKQIFTFLKIFWKPKESVYKHLYFRGVFKVPVGKSKSFKVNHFGLIIENEIFWNGLTGNWEKESLKLWIRLCERSDVVVDIGANTGIYSLVAKAVNPAAHVYAFEPHPYYFPMLEKNALINNFDIRPYKRAISNYDGTIDIGDYAGGTSALRTEAIKLDTFIEEDRIKKIDLIKIDVETHEPQVLEGFMHYLPRFKPAMIIEILDDVVAKKVSDAVSGLGYLYFNIDEKGSVRQTSEIGKSDYYNYLLCHPSMAAQIGLIKSVEK